jgi:hypothetical protein
LRVEDACGAFNTCGCGLVAAGGHPLRGGTVAGSLLILHLRKIEAKRILFIPQIGKIEAKRTLFIPQIRKIESEQTLFIPQIGKIEAKQSLFIPQIRKIEAAQTRLIQEIVKIEAKKMNWIEVKQTEAVFLKHLWSPRIDSKQLIPPAYALAGPCNNPIPARFLVPLDSSKVQALCWYF